jgi:hypothetical protein
MTRMQITRALLPSGEKSSASSTTRAWSRFPASHHQKSILPRLIRSLSLCHLKRQTIFRMVWKKMVCLRTYLHESVTSDQESAAPGYVSSTEWLAGQFARSAHLSSSDLRSQFDAVESAFIGNHCVPWYGILIGVLVLAQRTVPSVVVSLSPKIKLHIYVWGEKKTRHQTLIVLLIHSFLPCSLVTPTPSLTITIAITYPHLLPFLNTPPQLYLLLIPARLLDLFECHAFSDSKTLKGKYMLNHRHGRQKSSTNSLK